MKLTEREKFIANQALDMGSDHGGQHVDLVDLVDSGRLVGADALASLPWEPVTEGVEWKNEQDYLLWLGGKDGLPIIATGADIKGDTFGVDLFRASDITSWIKITMPEGS